MKDSPLGEIFLEVVFPQQEMAVKRKGKGESRKGFFISVRENKAKALGVELILAFEKNLESRRNLYFSAVFLKERFETPKALSKFLDKKKSWEVESRKKVFSLDKNLLFSIISIFLKSLGKN